MAALQDTKPENLPDSIRHYIGGQWVDSIDGDTFDVLNPVTNEPYITAASGKKADIEAAVAAALDAVGDTGRGSLWRYPDHEAVAASAGSSPLGALAIAGQIAVFAFVGIELVGTAAAETKNPQLGSRW